MLFKSVGLPCYCASLKTLFKTHSFNLKKLPSNSNVLDLGLGQSLPRGSELQLRLEAEMTNLLEKQKGETAKPVPIVHVELRGQRKKLVWSYYYPHK